MHPPKCLILWGNSKKDNLWGSTRISVKWLTCLCPTRTIKVVESLLLGTSLVLYITNFIKPVFTPRTFEHLWIPSSFESSMHFAHLCLSFFRVLKLLNWKAPLFTPRFFVLHVFKHLCITVLFMPTFWKPIFTQENIESVFMASLIESSIPYRPTFDWICNAGALFDCRWKDWTWDVCVWVWTQCKRLCCKGNSKVKNTQEDEQRETSKWILKEHQR